ncbi:MAG TPA: hypothetical protein VK489_13320 [Ferruginibacter sp.]|nr:hypothetical protein [Ferruginibacter sp.]
MRNLIIFGLFVIAMILVQFAHAQSADDVVDKYVAAMGGKEKLASLKTIKMEGSMAVQGTDLAITSTRLHMVGIRMDIDVMGMANYQVANKIKGSAFWPVRGKTEPEEMEPEQFKAAQNQMDVQGALFNYREKGTTVELVGKETVDGTEAYRLKVNFKNGLSGNYYIDTKTNRLVKTTGKVTVNGQEVEQSSSFSDYRQNADGYWFAYSVATSQGTVVYDKISTNIPVDESLFKN